MTSLPNRTLVLPLATLVLYSLSIRLVTIYSQQKACTSTLTYPDVEASPGLPCVLTRPHPIGVFFVQ